MKKILLVVLGAGLFMVPAHAQKQAGNEKNLEVHFAPLGGNPISIDGIRFRKFNAAGNSAWRVNLFIGFNSEEEITQQADNTQTPAQPELKKSTSGMTIGINPGYEMHMAGTDRLSPYCGAELAFTMATSSKDEEAENADRSVNTTTTDGEDGYTSFGLNLIAGVDYYFAKSIYLGAEFGWGFATKSNSDVEVSYSGFTTAPTAPPAQKQGSSFTLAPNAIGQIRLGFLF